MKQSMPLSQLPIVKSDRFQTLHSKWDLYIPFMELGMQLLKVNGNMTMIVPYPLTNQIYAKKLREMFVDKYDMFEIVDLKDVKVFEATVQNCIPFVRKNETQGKTIISNMIDNKIQHSFVQGHERLIQDKKSLVWNLTKESRETGKHASMKTLGDYCYISKGMVLNADEKKAKGEFKKADLISFTKDEIHCKKYIEGKDIDKFIIKRVRYLEWGTKRSPQQLSRPTFEELYTSKKLLFNCLGELKVAIDLSGDFYCEQAIRVAVLWSDLKNVNNKSISGVLKKYSTYSRQEMEHFSETMDLRFILGIMNSTYGSKLLSDIRGGDYHIVPEHIRAIPIPDASVSEQQILINIVEKIMQSGENTSKELLAALDKEVYRLYKLE